MRRKPLKPDVRSLLLHEAGYRCSNPACRMVLTLDIHHLDYVSERGADSAENLLPLCPNCHALHHQGHIPRTSLRAWKTLLLALNEGFDRRSVDTLLALDILGQVTVWGDGILGCAALVASDLVQVRTEKAFAQREELTGLFVRVADENEGVRRTRMDSPIQVYWLRLSSKGRSFVAAWKNGNQDAAIRFSSQGSDGR